MAKQTFIILSKYFLSTALVQQLLSEGEDVVAYIEDPKYKKKMDGIVEKIDDWHDYLGQGNIFIAEDCEQAKWVDWLREQGELVIGGGTKDVEIEQDRLAGYKVMKELGIPIPKMKEYSSIEDAIKDVKAKPDEYVFKQNNDARKTFNHVGKFEDGSDLLDIMEIYKKEWDEAIDGPVSFVLQEKVKGHEMAVGAYFNGNDWIRDSEGHVVVECNFEGKKVLAGNLGSTCGETTTMMFSSNEENKLFKKTLEKMEPWLKEHEYKGDIDLNCIITEDGEPHVLEPTVRFGYPALDMQVGAQRSKWGELLRAIAEGRQPEGGLGYIKGWTCVMVIYNPPFPLEFSGSERFAPRYRVYFLEKGKWGGRDHLTKQMMLDLHFSEVEKRDGKFYLTGPSGYSMTMTANGNDHNEAADLVIRYIEDYLTYSEMGYRTDAGTRLDDHVFKLKEMDYIGPFHGEELSGTYNGN